MVQNGIDPNKSQGMRRFVHLEISTNKQYLTSIKVLVPMNLFFDTIIDVDS